MRQRNQEQFLQRLWHMESTLVASGMPAMPTWWRRTIERFYLSGKRRLVVRKGRRVFASTCVAPRLAVAEMIFGEHRHLPGTPPIVFAFLSVKRGEAVNRLKGVAAILDALGVKYTQRGDNIELSSYPAIFSVVTANFRTSVGETVGFAWCDEVARWLDDSSGANPAEQVIGSLAPALSTLPDARLFLVSSPLGPDDYHARSFDLGETELQAVAFGETWTINPTLSKEETRRLEPDEKIWRREYAAIPSESISNAFDYELVNEAFRAVPRERARWFEPVCVLDASSGSGDAFSIGVCGYVDPPLPEAYLLQHLSDGTHRAADLRTGEPLKQPSRVLQFHHVQSLEGRFKGIVTAKDIIDQIVSVMNRFGAHKCLGDQRESFWLQSELKVRGAKFIELPWTNSNKIDAVARIRSMLADRSIVFPHDREKLRSELHRYTERITASGSVTYSAKGTGHDDEAALVITAILGDFEKLIPGSPFRPKGPAKQHHSIEGRIS